MFLGLGLAGLALSPNLPFGWIDFPPAVNRLLGYERRVGMSNRAKHSPDAQSNAQLVAFFIHYLARPRP